MKNYLNTFKVASLLFVSLAFTSCDDEEGVVTVPEQTIAQILASKPEYSSLLAAVNKANLANTFVGSGNLTLFAPTNTAFSAFLTANGFADLNAVPVPLLTEILKNHVINDELFSSELTTKYEKTLGKGSASSTNTLNMYVNVSTAGIRLNGVSSVNTNAANINASNGVIHQVDAVIGLPTIVTHATANSNFSILVQALTRPGNTTDFVAALSGTGPFTVFAPTNTAFSNATAPLGLLQELSLPNLAAIPEPTLDKVLKYHVIAGANVLAASLPVTPVSQDTFLGQTFMIGTSGGAKITDYNMRASNIVAVDVQCANGVIHVLDKVLLPNLN